MNVVEIDVVEMKLAAGYSDEALDHFENPRNVGAFDRPDQGIGTALVGARIHRDLLKLQIRVNNQDVIIDTRFRAYGSGLIIAVGSLITEWLKGKALDTARALTSQRIAEMLALPPLKIHCAVLAESAVKVAISDYTNKQLADAG